MALTQEQKLQAQKELEQIRAKRQVETKPQESSDNISKRIEDERARREASKRIIEESKKPQKEDGGLFSKATEALKRTPLGMGVNLGLDVLKSFGETTARGMTTPGSPISPFSAMGPTGVFIQKKITEQIPEKIETPLGEIEPKYSKDLGVSLKQIGEDFLNVIGAGAEKKTAEQLATEGAEGLAGKLTKSAYKISANDLKKNPNLIKDFLIERIAGTRKSIVKKADATVDYFETKLDDIVETANKEGRKIDKNKVVEATNELIKTYENSAFPEMAETVKTKVANYLQNADDSVKSAQEFKKNTYKIIKESGYGQMLGAEKEGGKQLARGVKQELERVIPEFPVADINKKIAIYAKARQLMTDVINKASKNELLPFKDAVIGTGGVVTGEPASSLGLIIARRVIESVPFKTYVAKLLTSEGLQTTKNLIRKGGTVLNAELNQNKD